MAMQLNPGTLCLQVDTLRAVQSRPEAVRLVRVFEVCNLARCSPTTDRGVQAAVLVFLSRSTHNMQLMMQDEDQVVIVTELCEGGDLEHFLKACHLTAATIASHCCHSACV